MNPVGALAIQEVRQKPGALDESLTLTIPPSGDLPAITGDLGSEACRLGESHAQRGWIFSKHFVHSGQRRDESGGWSMAGLVCVP